MYNKNKIKTKRIILARPKGGYDEWVEYNSQAEAAKSLNVHSSNINKAINKKINSTGGYEFKSIIKTISHDSVSSWDDIKYQNNIIDLNKGNPSIKRIPHEINNDIIGKKCCSCKEWKPLINYNFSNTHWDKLRNDCKCCLKLWRKQNRKMLNKNHKIYESNRKKTDPEFKLLKTIRSRINNVLHRKKISKLNETINLLGCSVSFLKEYLQEKFVDGMTWENHGVWHIDHIKPCCQFNLIDEEEQKKCFHYTNLQPLWAKDNLSKGGKYYE